MVNWPVATRYDHYPIGQRSGIGLSVEHCLKLDYAYPMVVYQSVLDQIYQTIQSQIGTGRLATYIPELAKVNPNQFGMALVTVDGQVFSVGQADTRFSIQSISKLFTLAMVMDYPKLWQRTGREPSGNAFNSLVQLEYENGIPRNPFINAGALVVTDIIAQQFLDAKASILSFVRSISGVDDIAFNDCVASSEAAVGFRNKALGYFLKSFDNIQGDVETVLDAYFHHCSIEMSCIEAARATLFLANHGVSPYRDIPVLDVRQAKYINSLLLTCGTYDAVGDFAYRVGLPAKSGVGGGIVAVMPDQFAVCVWSPGLNEVGNSLVGTEALSTLTTLTGQSIF